MQINKHTTMQGYFRVATLWRRKRVKYQLDFDKESKLNGLNFNRNTMQYQIILFAALSMKRATTVLVTRGIHCKVYIYIPQHSASCFKNNIINQTYIVQSKYNLFYLSIDQKLSV